MARRNLEPKTDPQPEPETGRRTFYGRRQGRRLRPGLRALLDELLPQIAIALPQDGGILDPTTLFDVPRAGYALEIGFGAGPGGDRKTPAGPFPVRPASRSLVRDRAEP